MRDEVQNKEEQTPDVDFVVSQAQLDLIDVNQALDGIASVECFDVNRCLSDLEGDRPDEQSPALKLLAGLTNYHFVPDHPTEPFKPMIVMGDRRSLVPADLLADQINIISQFAPTIEHLGLRARLSDVSWFMHRQRLDMAEMAITAYCDSVEAVRGGNAEFSHESTSAWGVGEKEALVRAARISLATRWSLEPSVLVKTLLAELVASAHGDQRADDFWRIAEVNLDHGATPPADVASMAEDIARDDQCNDNPKMRLRLLKLAARAFRQDRNEDDSNQCMIDAAECHVQKADLAGSPMLESAFLQDAIQVLRNYPNSRERREELSARLRAVQPGIRDEMGHFSTEIDLTEIVEHSVASVRGHSWPVALLSLALCDQPPTPDEIRQTAVEHAQEFPLQDIMPMQVLDFQGRVVFRAPGMGGDGDAAEDHQKYLMAFHRGHSRQVTVAGAINPIRRTIASEHPISNEIVLEILRDSPFIPIGHEYIFARAICHFLGGEDIEAVSLLSPQLENSLRHILLSNGHDTTATDAHGIQTEASLPILLNAERPWRTLLEEIIPSRYIHEIDLLFNFAGGPSIRNQVAHGKIPASGFWGNDFAYAAWLIIHLAIIPLARRWGDVEEIFARVTGLHRYAAPVDEQEE
ncbi:MAG: hypothetical protein N4A70_07720 [Pelagimonas sp.]|jgi:hypothetical protein|nr:hypothetical protein [Pelagimonas sp.]